MTRPRLPPERMSHRVLTLIAPELYRLGEYVGREPYPGIGNTDSTRGQPEYQAWGRTGAPAPKINLDDGTVIWGPECWWWPVTDEQEAALPRGEELSEK
jgi:hypothetical protein